MAEYLIHKACEVKNLKAELRKLIEATPGYLEENYIAQAKYDGCNMTVVIEEDGSGKAWSRTGEEVKCALHIIECLSALNVPGAYLGEFWHGDVPFNEISGAFRRQSAQALDMQFVVSDFLTLEEWREGASDVPYVERVERLPAAMQHMPMCRTPVYLAQSFGHLSEVPEWGDAQAVCNALVKAGGYDGLILRHPNGAWRRNDSGKDGEIIKVKAKVSYDLRVVDTLPGKGKHVGRIGSLVVEYRGQRLGVGTGLSDKDRERTDWVGKIVEVEALGESSEGLLREPRLKGERHDKVEPDA